MDITHIGAEEEAETDIVVTASGEIAEPAESGDDDPPASKKKQREYKTYHLTKEEEDLMVDYLRENELLWNKNLTAYRDKNKKLAKWTEAGNLINKPGTYVAQWFSGVRDIYTKLHKQKSGSAAAINTERKQWINDSFSFLKQVTFHRGQSVRPVSSTLNSKLYYYIIYTTSTTIYPHYFLNCFHFY